METFRVFHSYLTTVIFCHRAEVILLVIAVDNAAAFLHKLLVRDVRCALQFMLATVCE